jgi:hypothetical protein
MPTPKYCTACATLSLCTVLPHLRGRRIRKGHRPGCPRQKASLLGRNNGKKMLRSRNQLVTEQGTTRSRIIKIIRRVCDYCPLSYQQEIPSVLSHHVPPVDVLFPIPVRISRDNGFWGCCGRGARGGRFIGLTPNNIQEAHHAAERSKFGMLA